MSENNVRKITANTAGVLKYIQENDKGEGVAISEIANALGKTERQVRPVVTPNLGAKKKDGVEIHPALVIYVKKEVEVEGEKKTVGYAQLTDEGRAFDIDANTKSE